ncbi:hypothetical protein F383_32592 [Gossypium arboreum]|uniref:Uncharacterized protein n=1 Tax=Gossypium arboreum TaxID=29729 RepID=A0A0B0MV21_GOSAR|nr:hypothetical protein F383_32592 [Gossypium arboreum]
MRASVRPVWDMASASLYESQYNTMFGTWHQPRYMKASIRPCL